MADRTVTLDVVLLAVPLSDYRRGGRNIFGKETNFFLNVKIRKNKPKRKFDDFAWRIFYYVDYGCFFIIFSLK